MSQFRNCVCSISKTVVVVVMNVFVLLVFVFCGHDNSNKLQNDNISTDAVDRQDIS